MMVLMAKALNVTWKELCETDMMKKSFADVGLSLNIEDYKMKFQGQPRGKPEGI